jgi:predicted aspartyl protease
MTIFSSGLRARAVLALLGVMAAVPAAHAEANACKYLSIGELKLRFQGDNFQPVVEGSINNSPATMLVDTGSSASMLTPTVVERLDLPLRMTGTHAEGIGGATRLYSARLSEFGIGPAHIQRANLRVIGDMGVMPGFDAIVGADFLLQSDLEISLAEKAVRFFRPKDCNDDSFLAYWTKEAVVVPLAGRFGDSRNHTFTVELNGVKVDAMLDTGATRTTVFESAARKAGVSAAHASSRNAGSANGIGSDIVAQRSAIFSTFAIGGETIRDAELLIGPDQNTFGAHIDMLLGADFLRSHRVLFAMGQRQLYITYQGGQVFERDAKGIPDWLQREADGGNADAQFSLAMRYASGTLVPRNSVKALALLDQAAAQEHRESILALARQRMATKRYADAAALYNRAVVARPADRRTWLQLYLARLRAGEVQQAGAELGQRLASDPKHAWPAPVGEYFLGRLDGPALLAAAGQEEALAAPRRCEAQRFMQQHAAARGDDALAKSMAAAVTQACKAPAA